MTESIRKTCQKVFEKHAEKKHSNNYFNNVVVKSEDLGPETGTRKIRTSKIRTSKAGTARFQLLNHECFLKLFCYI